VAARLSGGEKRVWPMAADLSDPARVRSAMAEIAGEHGGIDILVNAAGISPKDPQGKRLSIWTISPEDWRRTMAVNLDSVFFCSVEAARHMKQRGGGAIVNISSVVARICTGYATAAYVASKAAVEGATRALALELAPENIRVNAVAPGRVQTAMTAAAAPEIWEHALKQIPIGRAADPQEIAAAVLFLASPASSYLIGSVMDVSGGRGMV
jgi:3-oxoacyl-[acyl-carrier protein] reductase